MSKNVTNLIEINHKLQEELDKTKAELCIIAEKNVTMHKFNDRQMAMFSVLYDDLLSTIDELREDLSIAKDTEYTRMIENQALREVLTKLTVSLYESIAEAETSLMSCDKGELLKAPEDV